MLGRILRVALVCKLADPCPVRRGDSIEKLETGLVPCSSRIGTRDVVEQLAQTVECAEGSDQFGNLAVQSPGDWRCGVLLMVIFGAGASFDSDRPGAPIQELNQMRPPLAKELVAWRFAEHATRYPACRPIVDRLRAVMDADPTAALESELARLTAESRDSPDVARQLMAFRFYLREIVDRTTRAWTDDLRGFTQYVTLLNHLAAWRRRSLEPISLVTFNYDRMLEMAAVDQIVGWEFSGFESYIERDDWRLIKLHGSVDWARVVPSLRYSLQQNYSAALEIAPGLDLSTLDWTFAPGRDGHFQIPKTEPGPLIPALAVPTSDKATFECPEAQLAAFHDALPKVTRLLVIGWRAAEPHAVEALTRLQPGFRLGVISDERGVDDTLENLANVRQRGRLDVRDGRGFGVAVDDPAPLNGFLNSELGDPEVA